MTVVIASGARYRKLDLPNLSTFEGRGVYYWASPIEAKLCARREVIIVGGGNSAGQATVFLASEVSRVHLLAQGVRRECGRQGLRAHRRLGNPQRAALGGRARGGDACQTRPASMVCLRSVTFARAR